MMMYLIFINQSQCRSSSSASIGKGSYGVGFSSCTSIVKGVSGASFGCCKLVVEKTMNIYLAM